MKKLVALFNPHSIAVIGASRTEGKVGNSVLKNIIKSGFKGDIYPVNPSGSKILGLEASTSIANNTTTVGPQIPPLLFRGFRCFYRFLISHF